MRSQVFRSLLRPRIKINTCKSQTVKDYCTSTSPSGAKTPDGDRITRNPPLKKVIMPSKSYKKLKDHFTALSEDYQLPLSSSVALFHYMQATVAHPSRSVESRFAEYEENKKRLQEMIPLGEQHGVDMLSVLSLNPSLTKNELQKSIDCLTKPPFNNIKDDIMERLTRRYPDVFAGLSSSESREIRDVISRAADAVDRAHKLRLTHLHWNFFWRCFQHPTLFLDRVQLLKKFEWTDFDIGLLLAKMRGKVGLYISDFFVNREAYPDEVVEQLFTCCFGGDVNDRLSPLCVIGVLADSSNSEGAEMEMFLTNPALVKKRVEYARSRGATSMFQFIRFNHLMTVSDAHFKECCDAPLTGLDNDSYPDRFQSYLELRNGDK